jgi:prevent-host-death family protein
MQRKLALMALVVSIGQVKRDISDLVNQVAYKGERIILTSRGRPKAVLVSLEDYEKIQQAERGLPSRSAWLAEAQALASRIKERLENAEIDVDALMDADRGDLRDRL